MKTLNTIRFILFGFIVLGCFANFAQNEYGLDIVYVSEFCIGLIFLTEGIILRIRNYYAEKAKRYYLHTAHLLIGIIFIAFAFARNPSPYSRVPAILALVFLLLKYMIYGIRILIYESKKGVVITILSFLFILSTFLSVFALACIVEHFPWRNTLREWTFGACLFFLLAAIVKRKYSHDGESVTLISHFKKIPGKMFLVFCYFSIWSVYITLSGFGIAPGFYTLSNPPAADQLKLESPERSDMYWENYSNFFENRRIAEEEDQ